MIVNLTPHPIHIYPPSTPDRIEVDGEYKPLCVIEPSGQLARLGMTEASGAIAQHSGLPIPLASVDYGFVEGLPEWDGYEDGQTPRTYLVVSLVVALASRRLDLLSPYREVRNLEGSVIGCRALARPV